MDRLQVVAPLGATIRGEVRVALTPDQHKRRAAVLGPLNKKGVYVIPEGAEITLKYGEVFSIDLDGRLNRALFKDLDEERKAAAAKAKAEAAKAKAEAEEAEKAEAKAKAEAAKASKSDADPAPTAPPVAPTDGKAGSAPSGTPA